MLVFFKARVEFASNQTHSLNRKIQKNLWPFKSITILGGRQRCFIEGVADLDVPADSSVEDLTWLITEAFVKKVELFTETSVSHIEFEDLAPEV